MENAASKGRGMHTYDPSIVQIYITRLKQGYSVLLSQNKINQVGNANSMPLVDISIICPKCRVTFIEVSQL